jgi:uridine kinase
MKFETLIKNLLADINLKSKDKKTFYIGITGLDASGKSQIASVLTKELQQTGKNVLSFSGDSFQFPKEYKNDLQEESWAVQHYKRTINFKLMIDSLLNPLKSFPAKIPLSIIDYDTKENIQKDFELNYPLIIIVESIYLFKKEMIEFFDYKIFLDISIEESLKRTQSRQRDLDLYGDKEGVATKYNTKNFPGYLLYLKQDNPKESAEVIIDNNDWQNPIVTKGLN